MVKFYGDDSRAVRIAGVVVAAWLLAPGYLAGEAQSFYVNDFAVRRSAGPVMTGQWYEMGYAPDKHLVKNLSSSVYNPDVPYAAANLADHQDNWRMLTSGTGATVGVYCRDDNGNQYGEFLSSASTAQARTGIVQPFYNSITDGVLRVQGDLRVPSAWGSSSAYIRLQPVARSHLTNMDWSKTGSLFSFGLQANSKTSDTTAIFYHSPNAIGANATVARSGSLTAGFWCRVRADLNLATGKLTFYYANLGAAHPTLETEATFTTKSGAFYLATAMSEVNGPIEGLAVVMSGISNSDQVAFDNLVCEWKKPGSETFERFYANDFNTRRYRTIAPEGTCEGTYAAKETSWTRSTSYTTDKTLLANAHGDNATVQQIGKDGWRRCNQVGGGFFRPVAADEGDNAGVKLAATHGSDIFVNASQALGMNITSGTLKATCDFRLPNKWYRNSTDQIFFVIGGDLLYKGSNATRTGDYYACRVGAMMPTSNDKTKFEAAWSDGGDGSVRGDALVSNTWYRVIVNLDLDTRKYGFKFYKFGETSRSSSYVPTDEELVCEKTDLAFKTNFTGPINSFSLWTYGAGSSLGIGAVYFDSIKFYYNESTTAFYECFGGTSTRRLNLMRGAIIGSVPQVDYGQDHWIRRHCGTAPMFVTGGENPALAADAPDYFAMAVQPIGSSVTRGRLRVLADIRPPRYWTWGSSGAARIHLGGDTYLQGISGTNDINRLLVTSSHAFHFGFGRQTTAQDVCGNMNDVDICYFVRQEAETSGETCYADATILRNHWYRFRATLDLDRKTYDLDVFDMGVAHPDVKAPISAGARVVSIADVPFSCVDEAISSLGVTAYGVAPLDPGDPVDEGLALYDNIVIKRPEGFVLWVR